MAVRFGIRRVEYAVGAWCKGLLFTGGNSVGTWFATIVWEILFTQASLPMYYVSSRISSCCLMRKRIAAVC